MNLLYLTFGENISNHIQAHFSIWSFLSQKHEINTINVVTDNPVFYNSLKDHVKIITINKETINDWKGEYNFFWRIKIKAIEMLCAMHKDEFVVYLDSDTFLYRDIKFFKEIITKNSAFMHENEGMLSNGKSKTEKRMWRAVKNKKYGNITINANHCMWNAGIVAIPNTKNNKECELALQITDEMCKQGVTRRLIEQFALSVSLYETYDLQPANNHIAHYWSNKGEWNKLISEFFLSTYFKADTLEQVLLNIKTFNYKELPVTKREKNTKKRLENLLEKVFSPREIIYIR